MFKKFYNSASHLIYTETYNNLNEKIDNLINSDAYLKYILTQMIYNPNFNADSLHFDSQSDNKCWDTVSSNGYSRCSFHNNHKLRENVREWFDSQKEKIFNDYLDEKKFFGENKRASLIEKFNYNFSSKTKDCQKHINNKFFISKDPEIRDETKEYGSEKKILITNLLNNKTIKYICNFILLYLVLKNKKTLNINKIEILLSNKKIIKNSNYELEIESFASPKIEI